MSQAMVTLTCLECGAEFERKKRYVRPGVEKVFCSHPCAGKYNRRTNPAAGRQRKSPRIDCPVCGKPITGNARKFCSRDCSAKSRRDAIWARFDETGKAESKDNRPAREYLIAKRGHRCEQCGLTTWLDRPIPLQLHHVDGNWQNGDFTNLNLLCPNCHALTENFGSKNRGNGRSYRYATP